MKDADKAALLEAYARLSAVGRRSLRDYAEFLVARHASGEPAEIPAPNAIPRPAQETVVKAIQRLRATYPMLDPGKLLHETSHYVSQHMLQGRPAAEVIDELETVFARHYAQLAQPSEDKD